MATTTSRRRSAHPMSYYWGMVKDMDDSQKLELITLLAESIKSAVSDNIEHMLVDYPYKRYTKEELNAMLDKAEANFAAGNVIDDEDVWRELEEEFAKEDAEVEAQRTGSYIEEEQLVAV